jgi:hypothetical protein
MTVRAHYDGHQIQFDEPVDIQPNAELWITILTPEEKASLEEERRDWEASALVNMAEFYKDEPDLYTEDMIIERNPLYSETR